MAADKRLFEEELRLLLGAHHQGSAQAARNQETSTHPKLKHMVSAGSKANLAQARRLEQVFDAVGATAYRRHDAGMQGICDANEAEIARNTRLAARDLLNIAYGQVAAHLYIARYGTLRSTACALGYGRAAKLLGRTLDETHAIDREFTRLYEHLISRHSVSRYPGEGALRATAAMHPALTLVVLSSAMVATALIRSSLGARGDRP